MYRYVPNALTMLRLVLAGVFFVVLNQYRYTLGPTWALWTSVGVFVAAALTDVLDGHLARKWQVETAFGRIMDPFCDKVLILGAFIYLSGPRFVDPALVQAGRFWNMTSGVYPWMIAIMLARELLVTGVRGELESHGLKFGAKWSGKLKTLLQSITVPVVIGAVALDPHADGHEWMRLTRDVLVYTTVAVTVISGLGYVGGMRRAMK